MSRYPNMKIEINEHQPLDEVLRELERIGAEQAGIIMDGGFILSNGELYTWCSNGGVNILYDDHELTTLSQLKVMEK